MDKRIKFVAISLLLLGLFCVAGYFWFIKKTETRPIYQKVANDFLSSSGASEIATKDTDNDGLRDWEETLWKTDLNKADTDGDGYDDGQEVKQGFDPLDPLSNPKTGKKTNNTTPSSATPEQIASTNLTENFAKTMSGYIEDPSGLQNVSPDNPFTMLDQNTGLNLLGFIQQLRPQIADSEIKTSGDNSSASVQKYATEVEKAIPTSPYPQTSEDDILSEAIEKSDFGKIDKFITYFEMAITNMKKITVPSDFFQIHKRETELLMATKEVYKSTKEINQDPLKTVLALQENQKIRQEMKDLIIKYLNLAQEHAK